MRPPAREERSGEDAVVRSLRGLIWSLWGIGWVIVPMIFGKMLGEAELIPIVMFGWLALNLILGWHKGALLRALVRQWNAEAHGPCPPASASRVKSSSRRGRCACIRRTWGPRKLLPARRCKRTTRGGSVGRSWGGGGQGLPCPHGHDRRRVGGPAHPHGGHARAPAAPVRRRGGAMAGSRPVLRDLPADAAHPSLGGALRQRGFRRRRTRDLPRARAAGHGARLRRGRDRQGQPLQVRHAAVHVRRRHRGRARPPRRPRVVLRQARGRGLLPGRAPVVSRGDEPARAAARRASTRPTSTPTRSGGARSPTRWRAPATSAASSSWCGAGRTRTCPPRGARPSTRAWPRRACGFTWHELNAVHAFMRDEGPRYDPALAALGYALALDTLRRALHA